MKEAYFIKPGNAYGYGYGAGEVGLVYDTDQKRDTGVKTKDGKPIMQTIARGFDWLQEKGVVRTPTATDKAAAKAKSEKTTVSRSGKKPAAPAASDTGEESPKDE